MNAPPKVQPKKDWFRDWFHTPYYELLYKHRSSDEASTFIHHAYQVLDMQPGEHILDIPCGRGRHTRALRALGLQATGLDINPHLIAQARTHTTEGLHFAVHDMRRPYKKEAFHYVMNLFTSLGYFATEEESTTALGHMAAALRPQGRLLVDFLNVIRLKEQLVPLEEIIIKGIHFRIQRRITGTHVYKDIEIRDANQIKHFTERVLLIDQARFRAYFSSLGLLSEAVYGDYSFSPFEEQYSERLILITKKI